MVDEDGGWGWIAVVDSTPDRRHKCASCMCITHMHHACAHQPDIQHVIATTRLRDVSEMTDTAEEDVTDVTGVGDVIDVRDAIDVTPAAPRRTPP
jgi:hypothetical protein